MSDHSDAQKQEALPVQEAPSSRSVPPSTRSTQGAGTMLDAALAYLRQGFVPLPCGADKRPLLEWKRFQTERPTEAEVRRWWTQWPKANIALVCGWSLLNHEGTLAVVDIDDPELSQKVLQELPDASLEASWRVRTPSGGLHVYFLESTPSKSGPIVPGTMDLKAAGGYVLAPPSKGYRFVSAIGIQAVPSAHTQGVAILSRHEIPIPDRSTVVSLQDGQPITEGSRNETLTSIAGSLRWRGAGERTIEVALLAINREKCVPPLPEADIRTIARSVSRYDPQPPPPPKGLSSGGEVGNPAEHRPIRVYTAKELVGAFREMGSRKSYPLLGKEGYIFEGWSHLFSGYSKSGKTTLLDDFIRENSHVKIIYTTEESASNWGERLASFPEVYEHVSFAPALGEPVQEIIALIEQSDEEIIIVDTIRNLLQFKDENDNAEAVRKLVPIVGATQKKGQTLILAHHTRKGGGQYGEGAVGAGAFLGIVDVALELRRDSYDSDTPRREIHGWGRIHQIEPLSYELRDGKLIALGSPESVRKEAVKEKILELLGEEKVGIKELWESMGDHRPGRDQVRRACVELAQDGLIQRDPPITEKASGKKSVFWQDERPPTGSSKGGHTTSTGNLHRPPPVEVERDTTDFEQPPPKDSLGGGGGSQSVATYEAGTPPYSDTTEPPCQHNLWKNGDREYRFVCEVCQAVWDWPPEEPFLRTSLEPPPENQSDTSEGSDRPGVAEGVSPSESQVAFPLNRKPHQCEFGDVSTSLGTYRRCKHCGDFPTDAAS